MLKTIFEFLHEVVTSFRSYDTLDAYITAGNPQNSADVEVLERQFFENRRNDTFTFFHE